MTALPCTSFAPDRGGEEARAQGPRGQASFPEDWDGEPGRVDSKSPAGFQSTRPRARMPALPREACGPAKMARALRPLIMVIHAWPRRRLGANARADLEGHPGRGGPLGS